MAKNFSESLRACASCEWVFRARTEKGDFLLYKVIQPSDDVIYYECPKCGFSSYSARYVYGAKCYGYEKSQTPWFTKKIQIYEAELKEVISINARELLISKQKNQSPVFQLKLVTVKK